MDHHRETSDPFADADGSRTLKPVMGVLGSGGCWRSATPERTPTEHKLWEERTTQPWASWASRTSWAYSKRCRKSVSLAYRNASITSREWEENFSWDQRSLERIDYYLSFKTINISFFKAVSSLWRWTTSWWDRCMAGNAVVKRGSCLGKSLHVSASFKGPSIVTCKSYASLSRKC